MPNKKSKSAAKNGLENKKVVGPKRRTIVFKRQSKKAGEKPVAKKHPLKKSEKNPIIEPEKTHSWESQYTFNPAAVYKDGRVHLVYRAIGDSGVSVLGYASTRDGVHVDEKLDQPVYVTRLLDKKEEYVVHYVSFSGGSWGGCEDPRITDLGERFYMTYTAFNGYPRVALTSIDVTDFLAKKWNWKEPVLISPPGEVHKNWVLFPEKINGKYAILHSISPDILIDYFESLNFDGKTFIKSCHGQEARDTKNGRWDSRVRGVGPPPIKTKDGWLVIYHAIDDKDPSKYKLGAMILDYKNPQHVLYRSAKPILEPDERYENEGFKGGIVYSCGAVVVGGTLFVYYGGADTVSCVATADLNEFLESTLR